MEIIKKEYLDLLKKRPDLKWKIVIENKLTLNYNGIRTVNLWIKENDKKGKLTKIGTLKILSRGLNVPIKQLVEETNNGTIIVRNRSCESVLQ